jgi:phosphonoacetaldehyde hydrolase
MMNYKSYSGPLKAVIFDWAGTTVDYGCFAPVAVFIEVFKRQGVSITIQQARAPMGLEKKDHIRAIASQQQVAADWLIAHGKPVSEADIDAMYHASIDIQRACVANYADLIPGTLETVQNCRARGLKIGSSTGYSRGVMNALLPVAAERGYTPDAALCPNDVPAGRPFPWMMYENAIQLGVYPMSAIVKVGDTLPDIEEGLNAGVWTISVTETGNELGLTAQEVAALDETILANRLEAIENRFRQAGAHYVVRTIADVPLILDEIEMRLRAGDKP